MAIAAGSRHHLHDLDDDTAKGAVLTWGNGSSGALGHGTKYATRDEAIGSGLCGTAAGAGGCG